MSAISNTIQRGQSVAKNVKKITAIYNTLATAAATAPVWLSALFVIILLLVFVILIFIVLPYTLDKYKWGEITASAANMAILEGECNSIIVYEFDVHIMQSEAVSDLADFLPDKAGGNFLRDQQEDAARNQELSGQCYTAAGEKLITKQDVYREIMKGALESKDDLINAIQFAIQGGETIQEGINDLRN
jgi:hypothetical protein